MFEITKSPVAVETVSNVVPLVSLTIVTVAPGMMPPCESFTVPARVPVVACPLAVFATANKDKDTKTDNMTDLASADIFPPAFPGEPRLKCMEADCSTQRRVQSTQ